jgi:SAM-dependent methyltransferase
VTEPLLGDDLLWESDVVANCAMNRLRQLTGVNSYARELGFNPLDVLPDDGAWLDLCCGSGRALIQAGQQRKVTLVGVDLVDAFDPVPSDVDVHLVCAPVDRFEPRQRFDLITCVHGLHYVGDKLGLLARAASWLTPTGRFVADLDPSSIRADGLTTRQVTNRLRAAGFRYQRRRISRTGPATVTLHYTYLGADDRAGPNYTGQPAVTSHYRMPAPARHRRPSG